MRCGHCGRTVKRKQWKQNELYCKNCQIFVCKRCHVLDLDEKCPRCLGNTSRCMRLIRDLLIVSVMIFETIILLSGLAASANVIDILIVVFVMTLFTSPVWALIIGLHLIIRNRRKLHVEYLRALPKGKIPKSKRIYSKDLEYEKEKRKKSKENWFLRKKAMNPTKYGYKGQWNGVPLTRDEFIRYRRKESLWKFIVSIALIVIGIGAGIPAHIYFADWMCTLVTSTPAIAGAFVLLIEVMKFFDDLGKGPRRISAPAKVNSMEEAEKILEAFIADLGQDFKVKTVSKAKMATHDLYDKFYLLEDNVQIGYYYGFRGHYQNVESFIFHFGYSTITEAQQVFGKYDSFLSDNKALLEWGEIPDTKKK